MRARTAADPLAPDPPRGEAAQLIDIFHRVAAKGHEIRVIYIPGQWLDVDNAQDMRAAGQFL